jgi:hypothetical protein
MACLPCGGPLPVTPAMLRRPGSSPGDPVPIALRRSGTLQHAKHMRLNPSRLGLPSAGQPARSLRQESPRTPQPVIGRLARSDRAPCATLPSPDSAGNRTVAHSPRPLKRLRTARSFRSRLARVRHENRPPLRVIAQKKLRTAAGRSSRGTRLLPWRSSMVGNG